MHYIAVASVALFGMNTVVAAQSTGLDFLHAKRKEGGRVCFVDHFHDGTGVGPNRKSAEAAAAKAWAEFTGWEYGPSWGSFSNAASKSSRCGDVGGGRWSCNVSARPCRPGA